MVGVDPDAKAFDRVFSSMMFHHLGGDEQAEMLRLMAAAGFADARRVRTARAIVGRLVFYRAQA